jgi:hypothetical protein
MLTSQAIPGDFRGSPRDLANYLLRLNGTIGPMRTFDRFEFPASGQLEDCFGFAAPERADHIAVLFRSTYFCKAEWGCEIWQRVLSSGTLRRRAGCAYFPNCLPLTLIK